MFQDVRREIKGTARIFTAVQTIPYLLAGIATCLWGWNRGSLVLGALLAVGITASGWGLSCWCTEKLFQLGKIAGRPAFTDTLTKMAENNTH